MTAHTLTLDEAAYPTALKAMRTPPETLWVRGPLPPEGTPIVAIVGTRQASEGGKRLAYDFAEQLCRAGVWTISGLARGIDTAAHSGSVGKSLAVIGSGLNNIYPAENKSLAEKLTVVSQFAPDTAPHAWNFPKRNLTVAAWATLIVVIEAPEKSGALITAQEAYKLNKKCFAIPGPIDKENFRGSNALIKEGKAELCQGVEEILALLKRGKPVITQVLNRTVCAHPEELSIISLLAKEDLSFDQLNLLTGLSASVLNVNLMSLVLQRAIREYPGRIYGKITNNR